MRGPIRGYIREDARLTVHPATPGHFVYQAHREVHRQENPSRTGEAEPIFVYGGVG